MKALYFNKTGDVGELQYGEVPDNDKLSKGEVKIRFLAGSLNHLDLFVLKGLSHLKYNFPHIPGADICGEIIESQSDQFKKGDQVILYPAESAGKDSQGKVCPENLCSDFEIRGENMRGVFSDEVVVFDKFVFHAPQHLSPEQAAALPLTYLTAWQMVTERAGLSPTRNLDIPILIHSAGSGVSQAILEILLAFGAKNLATTSRSEKKLEPWKKKGITTFKAEREVIKNWAGPEKIAVIFDHVGKTFLELNMKALQKNGKLVMCGATSGFDAQIDLRYLFFNQIQLLGSTMGSLKHFKEMLDLVSEAKISPVIHHKFPLIEAQQAYTLMDLGAQDGKIVLLNSENLS